MTFRSKLSTLTLCLAATALMSQETTGTITGNVTDKAGKPIPGARVQIASPALLGDRVTRTDASGHYRIALLPNGEYSISTDAPEFVGAKGSFRVLAGQTSRFDLALKSTKEVEKVQSAVVEVISSSTQVDKTDTVTQTNFPMESLNKVGNNDTDNMLQTLGSLTPGLSNSNLAKQDGLKIRGGTGHGSKTLINGVTLSEEGGGYLLDTGTIADMVDSMAVIQSPLNARYGNTDGGIVSMVTTKGSNTFSGSVRLNFSRPFWAASDLPYANRDGSINDYKPASDSMTTKYEYTIKGPLWKDHITFAYGGILTPTQYYPNYFDTLQNNPSQPTDPNGIFYRDQANGNVIRKSNIWASGVYTPDTIKRTYNQFVVFGQITPDHSLEWNYTQDDQDYISTYGVINNTMSGNDAYKLRSWNLGYKGILSSNGILEGRFARTTRAFPHPYSPNNPPIYLGTYPTYTPNPDGSYLANSLIEGYDNGYHSANTNGFVTDKGDTFKAESGMLNYQHILELAGTHLIDVGTERETFQWNTQAQGAKYEFKGPGQIADDLSAADISGTGPKNPAAYAGKYLVFNSGATLVNLDPNVDPQIAGDPVIGNYNDLIPQVRVLTGSEDGSYRMVTNSYYVNDLWTLNQNHSLMGGLRFDNLKVTDSVKTIASYSIPTLRFEYKFDIYGDQSRVMNASFGQFHSRQPGSLFYPMIQGRLANSTTYYWNQGTTTPYLVDKSQFLNLSNYGYVANQTYAGQSFVVDPNWKAPVSNEATVGFRRAYQSGGYWRATAIYRKWTNLFDFFPGQVFTAANGNQAFQSVLKNDPNAERTYKSIELEWFIPFTRKFSFGGNYTYARLMSNVRNMLDSPSRSNSQANNSTNFRDWYLTQMPRSEFNPTTLRDPEHAVKWYATYDLSTGKVKSNLGLRGSYTSGVPMNRTFSYNIPYPVIPGYNDGPNGPNKNTGGLLNTLSNTMPGYTNQDLWDVNLQYNVEFPIVRSVVWFTNVQVNNVFNSRTQAAYTLPAQSGRDPLAGPATRNPYGYQLGADLTKIYTKDSNGNYIYRQGLREFRLQTGIRF
jgi:hypothetical protein